MTVKLYPIYPKRLVCVRGPFEYRFRPDGFSYIRIRRYCTHFVEGAPFCVGKTNNLNIKG